MCGGLFIPDEDSLLRWVKPRRLVKNHFPGKLKFRSLCWRFAIGYGLDEMSLDVLVVGLIEVKVESFR